MKIMSIEARVVQVPLLVPFTSSVGSRPTTTRTVVRVHTDEGLVGLGETFRGLETYSLLKDLAPRLIGRDPGEINAMLRDFKMVPFFHGYVGFAAIAGLEVACWDLVGKASSQSLSVLFGGAIRDRVPVSGIVFHKPSHEQLTRADVAQAMVEDAKQLVDQQGVQVIKLKGSHDPERDLGILEALEAAFSGVVKLRVDPNAAWTVSQTLLALPRLEALTLEYLEDPVEGIDAMARVRSNTRLPMATNMCVVKPDEFAPAMNRSAVDVILADAYKWGGLTTSRKLAGACEFYGISMGMHSGSELGVSTAAHLHLAATTGAIDHAIDTTLSLHADDIIETPLRVENGHLTVPDGPGLGVHIDDDKLESYTVHRTVFDRRS